MRGDDHGAAAANVAARLDRFAMTALAVALRTVFSRAYAKRTAMAPNVWFFALEATQA